MLLYRAQGNLQVWAQLFKPDGTGLASSIAELDHNGKARVRLPVMNKVELGPDGRPMQYDLAVDLGHAKVGPSSPESLISSAADTSHYYSCMHGTFCPQCGTLSCHSAQPYELCSTVPA